VLVGLVLCTTAGPIIAIGQETPPARGTSAIEDILPKKARDDVCYSVSLSEGVATEIEDWSEQAVVELPVPGLLPPNGRQATRPEPKLHPGQKVTALTLSVAADDLNPTEPFRFILAARIKGWKRTLHASGPCNYFDPGETGLRSRATGGPKALGCYVECAWRWNELQRQAISNSHSTSRACA
jgi:hypothetical protein